jgi:REP element-mobilizing transposase RayT
MCGERLGGFGVGGAAHLFVCAWPITEIVKECERLTSHELRILKRLPSLWTRSYFAATAGNEVIQRYIAAQKGL